MASLSRSLLTEREKAAIRLHVFGAVEDWRLLYEIAGGKGTDRPRTLSHYVSQWNTSAKVQAEINAQQREKYATDEALKERLLEEIKNEGRKEVETGGNEAPKRQKKGADYTNPNEQKKLLNDLINQTNDPGEKLDALKVIISGQRDDRQAAKEGRQVRAYLPITCKECPIYAKEAERLRKKAAKSEQ